MTSDRRKHTSDICIDGKRISTMREIAKAVFGDSYLFIEVHDGRFVIRIDDTIDIASLNKFIEKYRLCRVRVYREIDVNEFRKK